MNKKHTYIHTDSSNHYVDHGCDTKWQAYKFQIIQSDLTIVSNNFLYCKTNLHISMHVNGRLLLLHSMFLMIQKHASSLKISVESS